MIVIQFFSSTTQFVLLERDRSTFNESKWFVFRSDGSLMLFVRLDRTRIKKQLFRPLPLQELSKLFLLYFGTSSFF